MACDEDMVVEQKSETEFPPESTFLDGSVVIDNSSDQSPSSFPPTTTLTKESSNTGYRFA